jgi:hypothetical protein
MKRKRQTSNERGKVAIPAEQDFIVRCSGRGWAQFFRSGDGRAITAFAEGPIEIELIGTSQERYDRAAATERDKMSKPTKSGRVQ